MASSIVLPLQWFLASTVEMHPSYYTFRLPSSWMVVLTWMCTLLLQRFTVPPQEQLPREDETYRIVKLLRGSVKRKGSLSDDCFSICWETKCKIETVYNKAEKYRQNLPNTKFKTPQHLNQYSKEEELEVQHWNWFYMLQWTTYQLQMGSTIVRDPKTLTGWCRELK